MIIIVVLLLAQTACVVVTGRLFKASGRAVFAGYLVGFFLTWLGVVIGLILLAKGPPRPKPPNIRRWGIGPPPPGGWNGPPPGY